MILSADLQAPLRRLPRTVVPAADESLDSYLRRLAHANRLNPDELRRWLTGNRKSDPVAVASLAAVSGRPAASLRWAMLELCSRDDLASMRLRTRPDPFGPTRPECRLCSLARGHEVAPHCRHLHEHVVCLRHQRWIGSARDQTMRTKPSLRQHPEILSANVQHRRLIRRHGRHSVISAFREATYIGRSWHQRQEHDDSYRELMERFHGADWMISTVDPTIPAATYPQRVALTMLLMKHRWPDKPADESPQLAAFIGELRRTAAPNYEWSRRSYYRRRDPLVEVIDARYDDPDVLGEFDINPRNDTNWLERHLTYHYAGSAGRFRGLPNID
ncbi:TniQ family protein [Hoyosella altamirensis]|uniref:TniQ domain-containing protein n=1 Tax=Hoyosella altamirensis TaxID=616997 RepID=A0A839RW84_9ACTN|nr:TniQ family protein [Hoyosella altamirensis]MBB3040011.1 hypothetical protein [Hoyosella altamirensis]